MLTLKMLCSGETLGVMGVFGVALTDESILVDPSFGAVLPPPTTAAAAASASSDKPLRLVRFLRSLDASLPVCGGKKNMCV